MSMHKYEKAKASDIISIISTTATIDNSNGIASLKIVYTGDDAKKYPLWLSFDSMGYAHDKAVALCLLFGGKATTTRDALSEYGHWRKVVKIRIKQSGKFPQVDGWVFAPSIIKQKSIPQQRLDGGMDDEKFWGRKQRLQSKNRVTAMPLGCGGDRNG